MKNLRICFCSTTGAWNFIREGYANALRSVGHQVFLWDKEKKSPHDLFAEEKFDILFLGCWELSRALVKCLRKHQLVKVWLWNSNWGEMDSVIDYKTDTVDRPDDEQKKMVEAIRENACGTAFCHYTDRWAKRTHDGWQNVGISVKGLPLAADLINFPPSEPMVDMRCDVAFVGGKWSYKGLNLDKYLLPLCHPQLGLKVRIYGWGDWGVANHLGAIPTSLMPRLFASAKVCPAIYEPLSAKYGFDVSERIYKVQSSGGFCISERVESAEKELFTNNEVVFVDNPDDFKEKVLHYVEHPDERLSFMERGKKTVLTKHTYFHRAADGLQALGLGDYSARLIAEADRRAKHFGVK